jgi:hypothetical protein
MKNLSLILLIFISFLIFGCEKKDETPPILTLKDSDTLVHVLNTKYNDPGATATDETDGNITANIFAKNEVNENKIGEYSVTYEVIDKAGNEAKPIVRRVFVYNEGYIYSGLYSLKETQIYPGNETCQYNIATNVDSTVNYGLTFSSIACNFGKILFAQAIDTTIVLPYQVVEDSLTKFSLQGNGYINDSLININYTLTKSNSTELWNATFERLK